MVEIMAVTVKYATGLEADAEGVVGGMAHAEHPLVSANGAYRTPDLVGEGLEGELVVGGSEGGGDAIGWAVFFLNGEEGIDGFFKAAAEEVFVTVEWDGAGVAGGKFFGEIKAVDRLQEKDGTDAMVEVVRAAAEGVELGALCEQGRGIERGADFGERTVAGVGVLGSDDGDEHLERWKGLAACRGDEFDHGSHDFIAAIAGEGHPELGAEKAKGFFDVESKALNFTGKVFFALGHGGKAWSEREISFTGK